MIATAPTTRMKKITSIISLLMLTSTFVSFGKAAALECPFLPLESAPPIEFTFPELLLKDFSMDLPALSFEGVTPMVIRKTIPFGSRPKITIERYSTEPTIAYDEMGGTVVISSQECAAQSAAAAPTSARHGGSMMLWTSLGLTALLGTAMDPTTTSSLAVPATLAGLWAATSLLPGAMAHQDAECLPAVQVVVEAPSGTRDAVEACYAEVKNNPESICPEPFPTYPTCNTVNPTCSVVVVGAATGGLYSATRLVDSGTIDATGVCIFEMQGRVGGRAYSLRGLGPDDDISVDAGGYRTWPQYTPSLHTLITNYLGLKVACYDESVPCERYNIVDDDGEKAGFASFNEKMIERLVDGGACWYPYHELVSVGKEDRTAVETTRNDGVFDPNPVMPTKLTFANGVTATATLATILNIPQRPLLKVVRNSKLDEVGILDLPKLEAMHSVQTAIATKLYLYYPRGSVFWKKLGLNSGTINYAGDAQNMLLEGRYHDGHVKCDDPMDPDTCHGMLLAVYATDFSGNKAQYFRRFQDDRPEPVTFITNQNLEGQEFLSHAHKRLEEFHKYENPGANYTGFQVGQAFAQGGPPTFAVLATWNTAIPWAGGGYHGWTDLDSMDLAMDLFSDDGIYVVTEAFSTLHGWSEGPIKVADHLLEKYLGVERPWDFPVEDIGQFEHDTSTTVTTGGCSEGGNSTSSAGSGGGTSSGGGSSGGGGSTAEDVFCFTEDALVTMADGTLKSIRDIEAGEFVSTGTGNGAGRVTDKLVHPIDRAVSVTAMETKYGVLMGTPSHPVLHKGEWIDFGSIVVPEDPNDNDDALLMHTETRYIDTFYNLEIDADVIVTGEQSSHSYVVNGVIASGLGDHPVLNRLYPRQQGWKDTVQQEATQ